MSWSDFWNERRQNEHLNKSVRFSRCHLVLKSQRSDDKNITEKLIVKQQLIGNYFDTQLIV